MDIVVQFDVSQGHFCPCLAKKCKIHITSFLVASSIYLIYLAPHPLMQMIGRFSMHGMMAVRAYSVLPRGLRVLPRCLPRAAPSLITSRAFGTPADDAAETRLRELGADMHTCLLSL
jgi:hypothetical protein